MTSQLILLVGSLALFAAFFGLLMVEAHTGRRALDGTRRKFDKQVRHIEFIAEHVNWSEFISHLVQSAAARIAHDLIHGSLVVVRFLERQLTRAVRALRDRKPNVLAPAPSREPMYRQALQYIQSKLPSRRR